MTDFTGNNELTPLETGMEPGGSLKNPVKAVLFDIYGTLFISASGDISTVKARWQTDPVVGQLMDKFAVNQSPNELLDNFFNTINATHSRMKASGIDCPEVETDKIWQQVLNTTDNVKAREVALYFEHLVNPVSPMPNLEATLARIEASSLRAGIISNAQFYTRELFTQFLGSAPEDAWADPDLIFYSYQYGYAKPSLYLFELAKTALLEKGIHASAALYIGNDMLNDIYPAHTCEFQTALFAGDARSLRLRKEDERCKGLVPDIVLTDLSQLNEYLFDH
ncbi:MAG: HAD family hydrolase [Thermodesulfobacteriota bacterium]|nr:HAD family hydrolase [Thermodesulfobacteriota bacterium]